MTIELKKTLYFFAAVIFAVFVADRLLAAALDKLFAQNFSGETGGVVNQLLAIDPTPDVLILGTSRAKYQIAPPVAVPHFPNTYNAGVNGRGGLLYQLVLLDILAQHKKLSPNVIIAFDGNNLLPHPEGKQTDYINTELLGLSNFYDQSPILRRYLAKASPLEPLKFAFRSYRYNGKMLAVIKNYLFAPPLNNNNNSPPANNGFEAILPTPRDSLQTIESLKVLEQQGNHINPTTLNPDYLAIVEETLSFCKNHRINLIFLEPPSFQNTIYCLNCSHALDSLCRQYQTPFVCYAQNDSLMPQLHQPGYWHDATHLNQLGANIFSEKLAIDITTMLDIKKQ